MSFRPISESRTGRFKHHNTISLGRLHATPLTHISHFRKNQRDEMEGTRLDIPQTNSVGFSNIGLMPHTKTKGKIIL